MSSEINDEQQTNKGWVVTLSGTGINLALGVLYAWSVVKAAISREVAKGTWDWSEASLNDPYAVAVIVFALSMVPAGRMLDRVGPRIVSSIGGVLVGLGFLVAALSTSLWAWILGFGVLAGAGIGFSYASATPAAVKWFPSRKTGLIAGLVVAGFGLASAYIAPLATWMANSFGISDTMLYLGIAFLAVVLLLSQLLRNPPAGYQAEAATPPGTGPQPPVPTARDFTAGEMLRTPTFWMLWLVYVIGAGAGLMVIGFASGMAKRSLAEMAWLAVTVLAVGNASGRVVAGILNDKIGRTATQISMLLFQAVLMFSLLVIPHDSPAVILLVATFIGFNYGSNLTIFPAATKQYFGVKHLGLNYGLMFTAWGVGGAVLGRVSQMFIADTGSVSSSAILAGSLLVAGAALSLFIPSPKEKAAPTAHASSTPETDPEPATASSKA